MEGFGTFFVVYVEEFFEVENLDMVVEGFTADDYVMLSCLLTKFVTLSDPI